MQHYFEALFSHGQVHPFGTFESFQSDMLAGSMFHLFIINSSSKFIWAVVHYHIVHIFPRRSIILWTKRRPGSRTRASCFFNFQCIKYMIDNSMQGSCFLSMAVKFISSKLSHTLPSYVIDTSLYPTQTFLEFLHSLRRNALWGGAFKRQTCS